MSAAARLAEETSLARGARLGRYRVERKLAVGGMAEIYLARVDGVLNANRPVVIKRLLPRYRAAPDIVRSFVDEARLAAQLHHPNIGQVHDIGCVAEEFFFVMEWLDGEDGRTILNHCRREGRALPLPHAVGIAIKAGEGLAYAHEKRGPDGLPLGIIHRDVSPSNIFVTFSGEVKLVDFGIAKAALSSTKTRSGVVKGKVAYMSPEQCMGRAIDRRSDVFALGIVLFELSTVSRLFAGESDYVIMDRIVAGPTPRPSDRVPEYPAELERIVMRALEREPARRYQSVPELVDELERFAAASRIGMSSAALAAFMRDLFERAPGSSGITWPHPLLVDGAATNDGAASQTSSDLSIEVQKAASSNASDDPPGVLSSRAIPARGQQAQRPAARPAHAGGRRLAFGAGLVALLAVAALALPRLRSAADAEGSPAPAVRSSTPSSPPPALPLALPHADLAAALLSPSEPVASDGPSQGSGAEQPNSAAAASAASANPVAPVRPTASAPAAIAREPIARPRARAGRDRAAAERTRRPRVRSPSGRSAGGAAAAADPNHPWDPDSPFLPE